MPEMRMRHKLTGLSHQFQRFEVVCLEAIYEAMPKASGELFAAQVRGVNKIQRLLDWKEIEFYSMRWFKVHWPQSALFSNHNEIKLASVHLEAGGADYSITVWAVAGHVFTLESRVPMKPLNRVTDLNVTEVILGDACERLAI